MKTSKILFAAATLCAAMGVNAQVNGSQGGGFGTFLALASTGANTGTLGGTVGTIAGGSVLGSDQTFNSIPEGQTIFGGNFLSAGPAATQPSTITFGTSLDYISFLYGSPDAYNLLTVNTTGGSKNFTAADLGLPTSGDQAFSRYVQFSGTGTNKITSLVFTNSPAVNAFESANFSITPVPEPETYALMLAGLGAIGFVARRRRIK